MPNKHALEDFQMRQFIKGAWLACEYEEQTKHNPSPLEKLAAESRAKAEKLKEQTPCTNEAPNIQLIKVMRDLKNNHPLSSG